MRPLILAIVIIFVGSHAHASGKIYYGSRVGMEVTVVDVSDIGTDHAKILVKHTSADAKEFCVAYGNDHSQDCVERELRFTHLNDVLEGNCAPANSRRFMASTFASLGKIRTARRAIRDTSS